MAVIAALFSTLPLVIAWLGWWALARELAARGKASDDWRMLFILASAGWAVLLTAVTEFAGWAHTLNRQTLSLLWWGASLFLWMIALRLSSQRIGNLRRALASCWPGPETARVRLRELRREWFLTSIIAAFLIGLGAIALLTPTTNWDSMTYHLPRVFHWLQQQSLAHYPTSIERQLEMGPWAAFLQLHLLVLSGTDQLVNMIQWCAMAGSAIVATLITRQLLPKQTATSVRLQLFAALLVVTLPIGIVESINPQTDYVAAFWFVCLISLTLEFRQRPDHPWVWVAAAVVCAIGLLSKATTLIYVAPFAVALLAFNFASVNFVRAGGRLVVFCAIVGLLNLPHGLRNYRLYGSPTGSLALKRATTNAHVSFGIIMSNAIRNAALHDGTGIRPLTQALNRTMGWLHSLTGRDLNDPETSFGLVGFKFFDDLFIADSYAGCPYHLALVAAAFVVCLVRFRSCRELLLYGVMILLSALLLCALLRWQRWNSRLHLPCLIGLMPFVAAAFACFTRRLGVTSIAAGLSIFGGIVVLHNDSRPIFSPAFRNMPRVQQMLALHPGQLHVHISEIAANVAAARCRAVGLQFGVDEPELPFWLLLLGHGFTGRIDHVLVENPSGRSALPVQPDVIISALDGPWPDDLVQRYPTSTRIGAYTLHWSANRPPPETRLPNAPSHSDQQSNSLSPAR